VSIIRAISWNVNGLRAVHKKGFLEWMAQVDPDILCIQETKAAPEQLPKELRDIPGYHSYYASSVLRKGYSGVALYTKREPEEVRTGFGIREFDDEGRILIADYGAFVLFDIYYPNGKASPERLSYKMRFYDAFLEYASRLKAEGRNIVVCGDVNTAHREIDIARPKQNAAISGFLPEEREWMDKLLSLGFVDTFRMFNGQPDQYTWWDMITRARERNVGWRIDYFFVSDGLTKRVKDAFILPDVIGSDHCPIGIEIALSDQD
jgi:exodeoxyribonuclease-3